MVLRGKDGAARTRAERAASLSGRRLARSALMALRENVPLRSILVVVMVASSFASVPSDKEHVNQRRRAVNCLAYVS